ncbi:MAG: HAD family hydrolase [Anaerolineaceae bacterium]|nr:HAD family hydrolase [Anaerolineaceae bacterium]
MKIKLIACDLDGTLLLNGAQDLQPETCSLITRLMDEKGILFCAASGRQYANLQRLFAPIKDRIVYLCENGCLCYCEGVCIHRELMEDDLAREIIQMIRAEGNAEVLVSGEKIHYVQPKDMSFYHHMNDVVKNDVMIVPDLMDIPEPYLKVSLFERGGLYNVEKWQETFGSRCTVVAGQGEWLDMMPGGVNKGSGLLPILAHLKIDLSECMAIGDNDNDREMLELVGLPVTVRTAKTSIRSLAKVETDTVEHLFEKMLSVGEYANS